MDIHQLIEMGLAGTDRDRVDIVDLEPVAVATEGVVGLSAIVSQLVYNATELLSGEGDRVHLSGVVEPDGYSLLIIDRGVGMSDDFIEGLNLILAHPSGPGDGSTGSGVQLVAALAARHGIGVRLEHGDPGLIARVTIPLGLLEDREVIPDSPDASSDELATAPEPALDPEPILIPAPEPMLARSKPLAIDTETFLESVFGPLRDAAAGDEVDSVDVGSRPEAISLVASERPEPVEPPESRQSLESPPPGKPEPVEPLTGYRRATLRTRVPGRNYNESDPTPLHTNPGEAAVEIKLALADFTRGRQAATGDDGEDPV